MANPQQEPETKMPPSQPTTAPTPTPDPNVHTTPRHRPHLPTTFEVSTPSPVYNLDLDLLYPRWLTLTTRTVFTAYDIAVLVVTLRFLAKYHGVLSAIGNPFHKDRYGLAVGTVAVALVIDPLAAIASASNRYGTYRVWAWAVMFDMVVGILGCCTPLSIAWVDRNGNSSETLGWVWEGEGDLIGLLALAVG